MATYRFAVGQDVTLVHRLPNVPVGPYEVVRRLPADGPDPEYRIRSRAERHDRVAREHQLKET